ncbi:glycosyltransferase [Knoellia koreensis]|uniref:Glycosyltransferase n=1 Tax=Knoellia koreensis TaxID=2730921 RepID=A0A849HF73_9MICO|nr:glycosyltransferase [Knoellia sp. DB2414S]NNM45779.1 glycosyltransferase [Knoellia sp. DB2414S]
MTRHKHEVLHATSAHVASDIRIFWKECRALEEAGLDVALIAPTSGDMPDTRVPVYALPATGNRAFRALTGSVGILRHLLAARPKVLHIHDPELIPLAIAVKYVLRVSFIYDAHEDLPEQVTAKPYLTPIRRRIATLVAKALVYLADRHADVVVAATPAIARTFSSKSTILVQNFPWFREYETTKPFPSLIERPTFCYVGSITDIRGAMEMAKGGAQAQSHPTIALAGIASPTSLIADMSSTGADIDYLGRIAPAYVPDVIAESLGGLILAHPLKHYVVGQPTKLFEYMASGRPFIASNFMMWREMLEEHQCGLFVDPFDTRAVAAAMDQLARDPDEARRMGERGRSLAREQYSFENEAATLVDATRRVIS